MKFNLPLLKAALICCLAVFVAASAGAQAPEPDGASAAQPSIPLNSSQFDLGSYQAALNAWQTAIDQIPAAELRPQLAKTWAVDLPQGQVRVPMEWLDARLRLIEEKPGAAKHHLPEIRKRLEAMQSQATALQAQAATGGENARAAMDDILARREFNSVSEPSWWDRMRASINIWLLQLLEELFGPLDNVPGLGRLIVWVLVALASCVLVIAVYRRLRQSSTAPLKPVATQPSPAENWQKWLHLAREAAAAGNYRSAIHHLYWGVIYRLAELGAWRLDRTRTHREYLRMLPVAHQHHAQLKSVTWRFESIWYGGRPAGESDFREVAAQLETLECESSTRAIEKS